MPQDEGVLPAVTVLRGNRLNTVFEMEHALVAFTPLTPPVYPSEPQHHFGIAILLKSDLLVIDLNSPGFVFVFFFLIFSLTKFKFCQLLWRWNNGFSFVACHYQVYFDVETILC